MMTVVDRIYEQVMGSECLATGVNTVNTVVGDILLLKSKVLLHLLYSLLPGLILLALDPCR